MSCWYEGSSLMAMRMVGVDDEDEESVDVRCGKEMDLDGD